MKIPESLKELVLEKGECEMEHRKYSEFYASWSYTLTEKDVESYTESPAEAYEFAHKWLKPEVTLERIEEHKVSLMPATVAMATGGLDDDFE